jgi:uncharacterized protein (TIGR00369 family)
MEIGETIVFDEPGNVCFGCSPHNPHGLQLRCTRTGERTVEVRFVAGPQFAGAEGVVHGGIQAALLDEALGMAIHTHPEAAGRANVVTAEFSLRYRRPVPVGKPLVIHGELVGSEGRSYEVAGRIEDEAGRVLTVAQARWVRVDGR